LVTLVAAILLLAAADTSAFATPRDSRLAAVKSFAFAIGDAKLDRDVHTRLADYGLVVVDGEGVSADEVAAMHANGSVVLGYVSVGSIEKGRFWYKSARNYKLDFWGDWGEWYADTSRAGFRDLISERVAPKLLSKGLDGLFLDNVDMIEAHPRQKKGMRLLVKRLSKITHSRGGFLFAQNGEDSIGPSLRYLDGWNREDVGFTYDFDKKHYARVRSGENADALAALRRVSARGLFTTATSYTGGSAADASEAVQMICSVGAIPFVSNILLTRIDPPRICPS
jgi:endo-alpha-1,4-polygalactosaminidase (GH114 family)